MFQSNVSWEPGGGRSRTSTMAANMAQETLAKERMKLKRLHKELQRHLTKKPKLVLVRWLKRFPLPFQFSETLSLFQV